MQWENYGTYNFNVEYIPDRDDIIHRVRQIVKRGDTILVMGARDPTLSGWAKRIL